MAGCVSIARRDRTVRQARRVAFDPVCSSFGPEAKVRGDVGQEAIGRMRSLAYGFVGRSVFRNLPILNFRPRPSV